MLNCLELVDALAKLVVLATEELEALLLRVVKNPTVLRKHEPRKIQVEWKKTQIFKEKCKGEGGRARGRMTWTPCSKRTVVRIRGGKQNLT